MPKDISRNVPADESFEINDLRAPMARRWMIPGRWASGLRTLAACEQAFVEPVVAVQVLRPLITRCEISC